MKSPFEAEFNREAVENLKKKFGIDEETVRRGSESLNDLLEKFKWFDKNFYYQLNR